MANLMIAHGVSDAIAALAGDKLNLRSRVFFAYGFHLAEDAKRYKKEAALALQAGYVSAGKREATAASTTSALLKDAEALGKEFKAKFAPELATAYASDADRVMACYMAMTASGVDSVKALQDWVRHGDALHTEKEKARKAAEKQAEAEALSKAIAEAAAKAAEAAVPSLSLDYVPQVLAPVAEALVEDADPWAGMDDAALMELIASAQAELQRRAAAVAEALVA